MTKARIVLRKDIHRPGNGKRRMNVQPKKAVIVPEGKDRLNLQIDEELKKWAQEYARRHHTSLTQMITDHFVDLRKQEDGEGVEQI